MVKTLNSKKYLIRDFYNQLKLLLKKRVKVYTNYIDNEVNREELSESCIKNIEKRHIKGENIVMSEEYINKSNINELLIRDVYKQLRTFLESKEAEYVQNIGDYEINRKELSEYQAKEIEKNKDMFLKKNRHIDQSKKDILESLKESKQQCEKIQRYLNSFESGHLLKDEYNSYSSELKGLPPAIAPYQVKKFSKLYKDYFSDDKNKLLLLDNLNTTLTEQLNCQKYLEEYKNIVQEQLTLKNEILDNQIKYLEERVNQQYQEKEKQINDEVKSFINSTYNNNVIENYIVKSQQYDSNEILDDSNTLPDFLKMGFISESISSNKKIFEHILNDLYSKEYYSDSLLKLPYCQKLTEGISLYIETEDSSRKKVQDYMKSLILKLFLTIPPGKLEATFIDPLEMGETFSMFIKLGEEEERIVDSRIWSSKEDVSDRIRTFRQILETRTQNYGMQKQNVLLKNESIKLLAITDFPAGFNEQALSDLQAIIRKSADYGIIVLINGVDISDEKLPQDIKHEITNKLTILNMKQDQPFITIDNDQYMFIPDIEYSIINNSVNLIKEINKKITTSMRRIMYFEELFDYDIDDPNNWRNDITLDGISIPIGIKGADSVLKMNLGVGTTHHALIAGQTGGGKTTLLHTIIMSLLLKYSSDELQLYLADFKEGIEFKPYTELKCNSFKVIAIDSEREFGLNILDKLCKELKTRSEIISQEGCTGIEEYRRVTKNKMPKIILIFDEIHELLVKDDEITQKSLEKLNKLVTQGRALGIHLILACQDFRLAHGINSLFSQIAVRIAIKGDEDSAGSILSSDNDGFKSLLSNPDGSALYNDKNGSSSSNTYFQVAYLEKEKRIKYLQTISSIEQSLNPNQRITTKVLLTRIEDDYFSKFNQFIMNDNIDPISNNEDYYGMVVGENFKLDGKFAFEFTKYPHSNLVIIGSNEETAYSLFQYITVSALYEELSNTDTKKDNELIDIVDCSTIESELTEISSNFSFLSKSFSNNQVKRIVPREFELLIDTIYERLTNRVNRIETKDERLFLMIFGIDRLHRLKEVNPYQQTPVLSKLLEIIKNGSKYGINVVIWSKSNNAIKSILGESVLSLFSLRILLDGSEKDYAEVVHDYNSSDIKSSTSVFIDLDNVQDSIHFRVYKNPSKRWIEQFALVYKNHEND